MYTGSTPVGHMGTAKAEIKSTIHQQLEITNGNFTYRISADGEFIKIARSGGDTRDRAGFFLIPAEMWDEVVNFVYQEGARRLAAHGED